MKATIFLTFLSASFAFITGGGQALADHEMSDAEQAGYDAGWDAANDFCRDLKAVQHGGFAQRSITSQFKRGCKTGFDDQIDSNRTCQRRMMDQDKYSDMWDARRDACS